MMPLALIGLLLMTSLIGWGVWAIVKSITLKKTTDRYRYIKTKDENGNEIVRVIDLEGEK